MFKRGYENGEQAIEIYEGNVDLVLYNDKPDKPSFYFYRFGSEDVLGEELPRELSLVYRNDVEKFLESRDINYDDFVNQLLEEAWSREKEGLITGRYEM